MNCVPKNRRAHRAPRRVPLQPLDRHRLHPMHQLIRLPDRRLRHRPTNLPQRQRLHQRRYQLPNRVPLRAVHSTRVRTRPHLLLIRNIQVHHQQMFQLLRLHRYQRSFLLLFRLRDRPVRQQHQRDHGTRAHPPLYQRRMHRSNLRSPRMAKKIH